MHRATGSDRKGGRVDAMRALIVGVVSGRFRVAMAIADKGQNLKPTSNASNQIWTDIVNEERPYNERRWG